MRFLQFIVKSTRSFFPEFDESRISIPPFILWGDALGIILKHIRIEWCEHQIKTFMQSGTGQTLKISFFESISSKFIASKFIAKDFTYG